MNHPDFDGAKQYAIDRLREELDPAVLYHSLSHTIDEVVQAVERMIVDEDVQDPEDQMLLTTAAYFHDLGYTEQHTDHEVASSRIAGEILPEFNYSPSQVQAIQSMIMATRLPQSPTNLLEEILADADLDVLGMEDLLIRNSDLRQELAAFGQKMIEEKWYENQLQFLLDHRYFTRSTFELRIPVKKKNIEEVRRLLDKIKQEKKDEN
jgi:uncharacterized protein